jgi:5-methylcytosine-specific restriction protein A
MKLQTLKPRVGMADMSVAKGPVATERMRGGNLQRRNRRMFLRNPLCVVCEAQGKVSAVEEWDHIVPLCEGGGDHEGNLQGLCSQHHSEKTALEARRRPTY